MLFWETKISKNLKSFAEKNRIFFSHYFVCFSINSFSLKTVLMIAYFTMIFKCA